MTKLEALDLSDNRFDGGLPPSMESLRLLNTFSASNNELSGELPSFLGSLTLLTCLALNGNQFSGTMPRELGNLSALKRLYLEKNELVSLASGFWRASTGAKLLFFSVEKYYLSLSISLSLLFFGRTHAACLQDRSSPRGRARPLDERVRFLDFFFRHAVFEVLRAASTLGGFEQAT